MGFPLLVTFSMDFLFALNTIACVYLLAFRGIFLPEKRILHDMICCPSVVNKYSFKGHNIPYLVKNVWYFVILYAVPLE